MALVLLCAGALLLFRSGSISPTWDEQIDVRIVECLGRTSNPFGCLDDITQARLPFYLHAAARAALPSPFAQYLLSAVFALVNVVLAFVLGRDHFDRRVGLLAAALTASSPAVLASGRMLLTHSGVILTTFCLLTVLAYGRYDRTGDLRFFWCSAVAVGLAAGSSVLGAFTAVLIAGFWVFGSQRLRPWQPPAFGACAVAVFFATTVIYLRPDNLVAFLNSAQGASAIYHYWNYLDLGVNLAPRWYSPLLFAIKVGPWWALLFAAAPLVLWRGATRRWVLVVWGSFVLYLLLKSAVFRYDAPHQQVQWYPLVFVVVAAAGLEVWRRAGRARPVVVGVLALFVAVQLYDTGRFFPNYLFYGAQYGDRFIGEFYGPAVQHSQDRAAVDAEIDRLLAAHPAARILMADNNAFERSGDRFVAFTRRDPAAHYEFAIVDRLFGQHFALPERDDYNAHLAEHYTVVRSHEFPTGKWAYRILRANPRPTNDDR